MDEFVDRADVLRFRVGSRQQHLVAGAEDENAIVAIADEETPLAAGPQEETSNRPWWLALIAAVAATVTGKTVYDKKKNKVTVDKDNK